MLKFISRIFNWSRFGRKKKALENAEAELPLIKNIADIHKRLQVIIYNADRIDNIKAWYYTLYDNIGDCEDFAILARKLLEWLGIDSTVYFLYPEKGKGHAICVFLLPGHFGMWFYFSTKALRGPFNTEDEAVNDYYKGQKVTVIRYG